MFFLFHLNYYNLLTPYDSDLYGETESNFYLPSSFDLIDLILSLKPFQNSPHRLLRLSGNSCFIGYSSLKLKLIWSELDLHFFFQNKNLDLNITSLAPLDLWKYHLNCLSSRLRWFFFFFLGSCLSAFHVLWIRIEWIEYLLLFYDPFHVWYLVYVECSGDS